MAKTKINDNKKKTINQVNNQIFLDDIKCQFRRRRRRQTTRSKKQLCNV